MKRARFGNAMRRKFFLAVACACVTQVLYALDADGVARMAAAYESSGAIELALHEYKRAAYLSSASGETVPPETLYALARCSLSLGEYARAYAYLSDYIAGNPSYTSALCRFELEVMEKSGYPGLSRVRLLSLIDAPGLDTDARRSVVLANALVAADYADWESALRCVELLDRESLISPGDVAEARRTIEKAARARSIGPKSAMAASAILPGAGQLAAGYPRDATNAFAVNAASIGGTAIAFFAFGSADSLLVGIPLSVKFYQGNIGNAKKRALEGAARNQKKTRDALAAIARKYDPPVPDYAGE